MSEIAPSITWADKTALELAKRRLTTANSALTPTGLKAAVRSRVLKNFSPEQEVANAKDAQLRHIAAVKDRVESGDLPPVTMANKRKILSSARTLKKQRKSGNAVIEHYKKVSPDFEFDSADVAKASAANLRDKQRNKKVAFGVGVLALVVVGGRIVSPDAKENSQVAAVEQTTTTALSASTTAPETTATTLVVEVVPETTLPPTTVPVAPIVTPTTVATPTPETTVPSAPTPVLYGTSDQRHYGQGYRVTVLPGETPLALANRVAAETGDRFYANSPETVIAQDPDAATLEAGEVLAIRNCGPKGEIIPAVTATNNIGASVENFSLAVGVPVATLNALNSTGGVQGLQMNVWCAAIQP